MDDRGRAGETQRKNQGRPILLAYAKKCCCAIVPISCLLALDIELQYSECRPYGLEVMGYLLVGVCVRRLTGRDPFCRFGFGPAGSVQYVYCMMQKWIMVNIGKAKNR